MSESLEAIQRVVAAFERSNWTEIDVRTGGLRVHLSAGSAGVSSSPAEPSAPGAPGSDAAPVHPGPDREGRDPVAGPGGTAVAGSSATPPPGAHVVASPSPGIFWRAPEPGAPPFVGVGDSVEASATVCIVEVMKLMNHLKAGVDGEVVEVYGRDGVSVDKGEPLFAIIPAATS